MKCQLCGSKAMSERASSGAEYAAGSLRISVALCATLRGAAVCVRVFGRASATDILQDGLSHFVRDSIRANVIKSSRWDLSF